MPGPLVLVRNQVQKCPALSRSEGYATCLGQTEQHRASEDGILLDLAVHRRHRYLCRRGSPEIGTVMFRRAELSFYFL